jgi:hypothetical protein
VDIVKDLSCLAGFFDSALSHGTSAGCSEIKLTWVERSNIPGLTRSKPTGSSAGDRAGGGDYIGGPTGLFGSDGPHMKVFEASYLDLAPKLAPHLDPAAGHVTTIVAVAFRHQEHMSYLSDEMNEAMSLYGRHATVDRKQGAKPKAEAALVQSFIRLFRKALGLEWFPQAERMFDAVKEYYHGKSVTFLLTGFSFGGAFASTVSAHESFAYPAIIFGACGVEDVLREFYPPPSDALRLIARPDHAEGAALTNSHRVFNFFHIWDTTPALDCQIGYACAWRRKTRRTNTTDTDRDGRVDAGALHAEEQRVDRDGDGDVDADDEMPTTEEADAKHLELVYGHPDDVMHVPGLIRYMDAGDMVPVCSGGAAYSHVFGSCIREA